MTTRNNPADNLVLDDTYAASDMHGVMPHFEMPQ